MSTKWPRKYLLNWYEILQASNSDPSGILILTYGIVKGYTGLRSEDLMKKLKVNHIPLKLIKTKKLFTYNRDKLRINFETKEPQFYFKNPEFLFMNVAPTKKISYLKALSTRRISDNSNKIPRDYFNNIEENIFFTYDNDYIYFPLEE